MFIMVRGDIGNIFYNYFIIFCENIYGIILLTDK